MEAAGHKSPLKLHKLESKWNWFPHFNERPLGSMLDGKKSCGKRDVVAAILDFKLRRLSHLCVLKCASTFRHGVDL